MLISLEGIDGSGKTTVWEVLRDRYDFTFTAEPTDSWYGDAVRRSVEDDDTDPVAELFLFIADHADHLSRVVEPALEAGEVVITDRYVDSRYAYQSVSIEEKVPRAMEYIQGIQTPWTREPDLTLYFDVDPETGAARSGATNKFERAAFLAEVRDRYERLIAANPGRYVRIDATEPPETVVERAEDVIEGAL
jgi:dTMP kinase